MGSTVMKESGEGPSTSGEGPSTSGEGPSTSGEGPSTSGEGPSTASDTVSAVGVDLEESITMLMEAVPTVLRENVPPLIRAAATRDCGAVRHLVELEDGLNAPNGHGQTPLHWAVIEQGEPILESLMALGRLTRRLRLDAAEDHSFTALHYAAVTRNSYATHVLLEAGAAVDCRDENGQTPLMKAAKWDDVAQCRSLLNAGADATAMDMAGRTALHLAAAAGHAGAVELLLQHGAHTDALDSCGRTPLATALRLHRLDAAHALLRVVGTGGLSQDFRGRSELHWAAANGTADIVRRLLSLSPHRWILDRHMMTPLARALEVRNEATAAVLLEVPSHCLAVPDAHGRTVLHWAARAGLAQVVLRLLDTIPQLSVWTADREGRDVLMLALRSDDAETVAAVLGHDGFRQRADNSGRTALHVAAMRGNAAATLTLLQHGADPDIEDCQSRTPLAWALCGNLDAVADVLRCYSAEEPPLGDMV